MRAPQITKAPEITAALLTPAKRVSAAQLAANAANAQHSTGPRTPEGKARVAQNALKHGLYSPDSLKAATHLGEDPAEFATLLGELMEDCEPQDRSERDLVQRMASLMWRLARVHRAMEEKLAYLSSVTEEEAARNVWPYSLFGALENSQALSPLEAHLSRELSHLKRDLAFSQRYRDARADKLASQDRRSSRAEPKMTEASLIALLDAQEAPYLAAARAQYPEPEYDEEAEAIGEEAYQALLASKKRRSHHSLSAESGEQTQSGAAQEAPQSGDGSSNLT